MRELLWFCLPALLVGLALRVWLTVGMPYAYFQPDSPDLLVTPDHLFNDGKFDLHQKKTFLVPILYTAAFLIPKVPALVSIPVFQHLLGLVAVVMVGGVARLWFRHWKWVVVPVTMVMAVHPSLLWYEHTLMAESVYVFCTVLLALVATAYALRPTNGAFIALCAALFLEAGARPEGKLFFCFALLLVALLHWGDWRLLGWRAGVLVPLGLALHLVTKTSQAGLLLFISVLHMAPDELKCAPGIMAKLAPLKAEVLERWDGRNAFPRARHRKEVAGIVKEYLKEKGKDSKEPATGRIGAEALCQKMAKEVIIRRWWLMPRYALAKFENTADSLPSGGWTERQLRNKQLSDAYIGDMEMVSRLSKRLHGQEIKTIEELTAWVGQNYDPAAVEWYMALREPWERVVSRRSANVRDGSMAGVPYFYWVVAAGLVATLLSTLPQWKLQMSWAVMIVGLAFVIILTANVKARFRLVFEPFYFLYLAGIPNLLLACVCRLWRRDP